MRFELRPGVRRLFRLPRTNAALHADIDDELESLIASRVDALVARGMSPADARAEALRRLGVSLDDARKQLHHSAESQERRMAFREHIENLVQDLRYAARGLARRPAFTAVAVLTLAIGIGATTAIFSAVNVLLLRPLPYANPDELMKLTLVTPARANGRPGTDDMVWSYPKFVVLRNAQQSFTNVVLYSDFQFTFSATEPERLHGETIGARYFELLGVPLLRGRAFDPSIDSIAGGAPREVILSYALWDRRFNADPAVIGQTVQIDRQPWVVIGIAPRDFKGLTGEAQVFTPITARPAADLKGPQSHEFWVVARRKPGVSIEQARAEAVVLGSRIDATYHDLFSGGHWSAKAAPLDDARLAPTVKQSLLILFGAVGFVLLIACVNVANLLLGRASARRREIAVRLAIGAGRARLVRLLLTESVLLALVGGIASVGVAWVGVRALETVNPATTLRVARDSGLGAMAFSTIRLDWTALAFTLGVAIAVGVVFGLVPAMSASRASLTGALKDDALGKRSRIGGGASRRLLVATEVALAIVLLAGSGLMIRSLAKLLAIDPGFDGRNVLTFRLNLPPGSMQRDSIPGFYTQIAERMRAIPGVDEASLANCTPLNGGCNGTGLVRLDRPKVDMGHAPFIGIHWVSPTWFSTLRIPILRGRGITDADRAGTPQVVVINDVAAKRIWPGEDPIGKHVELGQGDMDDAEVVGIVGGVRQQQDSAPRSDVYISYAQAPRAGMVVFLRTTRAPASLGADVRRAVREIAPTLPVYDMQTMAERTAAATARARFSATLLALFALTALSLAAIGIYGVMSLAVTARTRELGIRIALGADKARVQRLVIGEGISLVAVGALVGIVVALFATRVLRTMLFDLAPSDPMTYAGVAVLLALTAIMASWLPARRASRVDPIEALRAE